MKAPLSKEVVDELVLEFAQTNCRSWSQGYHWGQYGPPSITYEFGTIDHHRLDYMVGRLIDKIYAECLKVATATAIEEQKKTLKINLGRIVDAIVGQPAGEADASAA